MYKEKSIPLHVEASRTLRLKIIDTCGMTCTFCHNEGTPVVVDNTKRKVYEWTDVGQSGRRSIYLKSNGASFLPAPVFPNKKFENAIRLLKESLGLDELHLTGGEPTLHPQLADIFRVARSIGYRVCMTSNGENGKNILAACGAAGLDRVNFSIFGTTAEELSQVQHEKYQDKQRAERKIEALKQSIQVAIDNGIKASANIVVPDYTHAPRIKRLLEDYSPDLSVRLLNSLDDKPSMAAIYKILDDLKAVPIARYITAGVSGCRIAYRLPSGRTVYFKQIRKVRLPKTCSSCRFNNDTDCQEGYYGVRLYLDRGGVYQVGVCIQRMDLCMPLEKFIVSDLCREIIDFQEKEYQALTHKGE